MAQRTITITLGFEEDASKEAIEGVVDDLQTAIYSVLDAGNYNDECPGYDNLNEVSVV